MTRDELEQLSREELVDLVMNHQVEIERLQVAVTELESQLQEMAAQPRHPPQTLEIPEAEKETSEHDALNHEWEEATRDALRHLADASYLEQSPLAELIAGHRGVSPKGPRLQQKLLDAINDMQPGKRHPRRPRQQRRYDILRMAYLEKKKVAETARMLAISERQYYRELKTAIRGVARYVQDQFP